MPTLMDYRRRIRSVKSTQQITRAMKFVAAAKLRRAQEGVFSARPYAREILRVLRSAAARIETIEHPLLERRPEEKVLVVLLTGDRSLCGAFNTNVIRRGLEFLRDNSSKKLEIIVVGKKGRDTLKKRGRTFAAEYLNVSSQVEFSKAKEIATQIAEMYRKREVDTVYVIYNEFKNVMVQNLRSQKLLPIDPEVVTGGSREAEEKAVASHAPSANRCPWKPHRAAAHSSWTTFTKSPSRRSLTASSRAIWKRKFSASCLNRRLPNTPPA